MTRDFLKGLGIDDTAIEKIMTEHGKTVQAEQAKKGGLTEEDVTKAVNHANKDLNVIIEGLNAQIITLTNQKSDLDKIIKEAPNLDEAIKNAVEEAGKAHKTAMAELEKEHNIKTANMQRDSETADFLHNLGKKFITPETETIFRQRLNDALLDKANEGKNRADIFAGLIKGTDGKDRTDIFATDTPQNSFIQGLGAAGPGTGTLPDANNGTGGIKFNFAGIRGRGGNADA